MAIPIIGPIISLVNNGLTGFLDIRKEKTKGKLAVAKKYAEGDVAWELEQVRGMQHSWKDEWFTIVLSIPLVGVFFPQLVPYFAEGFLALESLPEWYQRAIQIAIFASFGVKLSSSAKKVWKQL